MRALRCFQSLNAAARARRAGPPHRRGFSIVLFSIGLVALVAFVSMAVDIGRVRLARTQLQTAADAAALAAAHALQYLPQVGGITQVQDLAIDTAEENASIDQKDGGSGGRADRDVALVREEDIEFGIWRPDARTFFALESDGTGVDERREANAVRVWGRRCTTYDKNGETIQRNTGVPLIFAPILPNGPLNGEVQQQGTVRLMGGSNGYGFIGLDWVKFNGTTKTDSYHAVTETYPGADGQPNQNSTVSSNGNIELVGGTQMLGDVHPGVEGSIQPYPLGSNVQVTGYMNPLDRPLTAGIDYTVPVYSAPSTNDNNTAGAISPKSALKGNGVFQATANTTISSFAGRTAKYVFSSYSAGSHDKVTLDNTNGPIEIWVNGNFSNGAQAELHIKTNSFPVTFHINGNFDMQGGGVINDQAAGRLPSNLLVEVTKSNTSVDIGGSPTVYMHLNAPLSDIKVHGHGSGGTLGFYGWAVGKSLFVTGNMEAHYDETLAPKVTAFSTHLVD